MSKHTPGPWAVGTDFDIWAGHTHIARANHAPHNANKTANARLIAAAPDLLEALKELQAQLLPEYGRDGGLSENARQIAWNIATDAVNKAKGK